MPFKTLKHGGKILVIVKKNTKRNGFSYIYAYLCTVTDDYPCPFIRNTSE